MQLCLGDLVGDPIAQPDGEAVPAIAQRGGGQFPEGGHRHPYLLGVVAVHASAGRDGLVDPIERDAKHVTDHGEREPCGEVGHQIHRFTGACEPGEQLAGDAP